MKESSIKITADSTADLSEELLAQYGISLVPLYITLGEDVLRDRVDITRDDVFAFVAKTGTLPKTSAVSSQDYADVFASYAEKGMHVVHVCISSDFSACYQNACFAAKDSPNVHVVDSRNLSTGTGHLALMAAELASEGLPASAVAERLRQATGRIEASFVIQTLDYLYKGGRCSALASLGANLLQLRPCIEVQEGKMTVGKKYRGSPERCLNAYVLDRLENRRDIDPKRIFITHSYLDDEAAHRVKALVEQTRPFDEILITRAGCTISSHCGPGTLGILFLRK